MSSCVKSGPTRRKEGERENKAPCLSSSSSSSLRLQAPAVNQGSRKPADKVAAAGFFVVVPDFFYGDPVNPDNPQFDRESWFKAHSKFSTVPHTNQGFDMSHNNQPFRPSFILH